MLWKFDLYLKSNNQITLTKSVVQIIYKWLALRFCYYRTSQTSNLDLPKSSDTQNSRETSKKIKKISKKIFISPICYQIVQDLKMSRNPGIQLVQIKSPPGHISAEKVPRGRKKLKTTSIKYLAFERSSSRTSPEVIRASYDV